MIALGKVVSLFAGLLLLAGYTAAAFAAETSKDEAAIRAINPAWVKAYNAGDAKAISGLYASPTLINNVETITNVPKVLELGPEEYAQIGTPPDSTGTRVFCLSGNVVNPGAYEAPHVQPRCQDRCGHLG